MGHHYDPRAGATMLSFIQTSRAPVSFRILLVSGAADCRVELCGCRRRIRRGDFCRAFASRTDDQTGRGVSRLRLPGPQIRRNARRGAARAMAPGRLLTRPKTKAPALGGRFGRSFGTSAVGLIPGDPRNVRAADADIGQFAIAELRELAQAGVVAPPGPEEPDNSEQHDTFLSSICWPADRPAIRLVGT